jgi:hypothetical protein
MNFWNRVNLIVTNKRSLFIFATTDNWKSTIRYVLTALAIALSVGAFFDTSRVIKKLPLKIEESFGVLSVDGGVLSAPSNFAVSNWEIKDLVKTVFSYNLNEAFIPESSVVFAEEVKDSSTALATLTPNGVNFGGINSFFPATFSWKQLVGDNFSFSESESSALLKRSSISLFFSMTVFAVFNAFRNLLYLAFVLIILIFIISRDAPVLKKPKIMSKFILLGLTPYYILTPVFAIAGTKAEWLADVSLLFSALLISRTVAQIRLDKKRKESEIE